MAGENGIVDGREDAGLSHFLVEEASRLQVVQHAGCTQRERSNNEQGGRRRASVGVGGQQTIKQRQKLKVKDDTRYFKWRSVLDPLLGKKEQTNSRFTGHTVTELCVNQRSTSSVVSVSVALLKSGSVAE